MTHERYRSVRAAAQGDGLVMIAGRGTPRWVTYLAASAWLATLLMGLAVLWVTFGTDFLQLMLSFAVNSTTGADNEAIVTLAMIAFSVVPLGYASVGALLVGRPGAGRVGATLLTGGVLFVLVPFGYMVGGFLSLQQPDVVLYQFVLLLGPVAIGPGTVAILPVLAIVFPDGRLPSPRWRKPVAIALTSIGLAALVQLVRPDTNALAGGPFNPTNPIGIDALPSGLGELANIVVPLGVIGLLAMGVIAVIVRYRRGTPIERQQARWFVAAVALAALPLSFSFTPPFGGPAMLLVASLGLLLVPIAVGIAVTRYRLYEIDRLINRTLVYVPLTAIVAGLYAGVVALLQRVFQSVTGDTSDAAIVISTLILASVFTPLRKWLEGIVDRRYKPASPTSPPDLIQSNPAVGPDWDGRMAAIALRVVRSELAAKPVAEPAAVPPVA